MILLRYAMLFQKQRGYVWADVIGCIVTQFFLYSGYISPRKNYKLPPIQHLSPDTSIGQIHLLFDQILSVQPTLLPTTAILLLNLC